MRVGWISSSESAKCCGCGERTSKYKTYEQSGMQLRIPACSMCDTQIYVDDIADAFMRLVKKQIKGDMFR